MSFNNLKQNFIFDLDGTLWDTVYPCAIAWNKALTHIGLDHLQISEDNLKALVGRSQLQIFAELFPKLNKAQTEALKNWCKLYQEESNKEMGGKLYEGLMETLDNCIEGISKYLLLAIVKKDISSFF